MLSQTISRRAKLPSQRPTRRLQQLREAGRKKKAENKKPGGSKDKWAWKEVPPKEGEGKTKTVNGKEYHWCPNHEAWTLHTPKECKKKPKEPEEIEANEADIEEDDDNDSNPGYDEDVQSVLNSFAAAVALNDQ